MVEPVELATHMDITEQGAQLSQTYHKTNHWFGLDLFPKDLFKGQVLSYTLSRAKLDRMATRYAMLGLRRTRGRSTPYKPTTIADEKGSSGHSPELSTTT